MAPMATKLSRAAPSMKGLARIPQRVTPGCALASRAVAFTPMKSMVRYNAQAPTPPPQTHYAPLKKDIRSGARQSSKGILPEFNMKGKVIVVSGGAQGLGLVQVEALLEAGTTVHVFDRQPQPGPDSNFARVASRAEKELGTSLLYHQVDVRTGVDELNTITEEIADKYGRLDGLIAAAGVQQETTALQYTAADSDWMLGVNVTGVLMTSQAVARQMVRLKSPGSIVMIASMSGTVANRGLICPVYNASKAAVLQLARNLAMEWGNKGIRVNTISPGYIVTEMVEKLFVQYPEREIEWPRQNMLGRLSSPADYRGAAVFLLSDASRFMTGADLRIDGGHAAW
ncbi:hypothetical protein F4780DRAFT_38006 [Xylariomycetidae sp. FL0641]|nr:hypothetical protein F4780DRAFT_38006 [Xylariomycetidae sp. FL0641]